MRVYVAYVTQEEGLGTYVLGVRRREEDARTVCQAHFDHYTDDGKQLEWSQYRDQHAHGVQSVQDPAKLTYYIEATELDFQTDSKVDERILDLEIRLGQLAQSARDQMGMWQPLEKRQIQLENYIDHLIGELRKVKDDVPDPYEFPGGEIWMKGEQV